VNGELYAFLFAGLGGTRAGDEGWYGDLPYSVDHDVKVLATWLAPYGFQVSSSLEWLSGYHWERKGWSEAFLCYLTFPEGRGTRTTPSHAYVDLGVDKEFALAKGLRLALGVNVYNLFNSQQPVSYVKEDTELFGQVWARQLPRWVQLKATLRF
jgi:outer membrane receptor protein involved in Fe transport